VQNIETRQIFSCTHVADFRELDNVEPSKIELQPAQAIPLRKTLQVQFREDAEPSGTTLDAPDDENEPGDESEIEEDSGSGGDDAGDDNDDTGAEQSVSDCEDVSDEAGAHRSENTTEEEPEETSNEEEDDADSDPDESAPEASSSNSASPGRDPSPIRPVPVLPRTPAPETRRLPPALTPEQIQAVRDETVRRIERRATTTSGRLESRRFG
jgi:hypothetical protein